MSHDTSALLAVAAILLLGGCGLAVVFRNAAQRRQKHSNLSLVSRKKSRESEKRWIKWHLVVLAKGQMKLSEKKLKLAEKTLKLTKRLLELEAAEPCAPPNGGPAEPLGNSGVVGGPPSVS
jgi:outer membrane lipopolysaccharide assembly protein LptE/RlpB